VAGNFQDGAEIYISNQKSQNFIFGFEFYPTVFLENYEGLQGKFRPYGIAGVGFFHFNPKAYYYSDPNNLNTKQLVELKPLRLEGQGMSQYPDRKEYNLTQLEILWAEDLNITLRKIFTSA
jgi:hypothetical protein